jgi:hypothetical protein
MIHFTRPTTCRCNTSISHQSTATCCGGQLPSSGRRTSIENPVNYDTTCSVKIKQLLQQKKIACHYNIYLHHNKTRLTSCFNSFVMANALKNYGYNRRSLDTIQHVILCQYSVYSKHHNLCLHILKSCCVIMISGVITVHTVSQFSKF